MSTYHGNLYLTVSAQPGPAARASGPDLVALLVQVCRGTMTALQET